MTKQAPHYRHSKKGRRFKAGRGKRKVKKRGGPLFDKYLSSKIDIRTAPAERKKLLHIFEKNPELIEKAKGGKIVVNQLYHQGYHYDKDIGQIDYAKQFPVYGLYNKDKDKINIDKKLFSPHKVKISGAPSDRRVVFLSMEEGGQPEKILRHELEHRKQAQEGRLPNLPSYLHKKRVEDYTIAHDTDPLEIEAEKATKVKPVRDIKVRDSVKGWAFRGVFK